MDGWDATFSFSFVRFGRIGPPCFYRCWLWPSALDPPPPCSASSITSCWSLGLTWMDRLSVIEIHDSTSNEPYGRTFFSQPEFAELQKNSHIFRDNIAAHPDRVLWMHGSTPESLQSTLVSGNAFQILGVPPLMGRFLLPADAKPAATAVFVMSYKMWQQVLRQPGSFGKDIHV